MVFLSVFFFCECLYSNKKRPPHGYNQTPTLPGVCRGLCFAGSRLLPASSSWPLLWFQDPEFQNWKNFWDLWSIKRWEDGRIQASMSRGNRKVVFNLFSRIIHVEMVLREKNNNIFQEVDCPEQPFGYKPSTLSFFNWLLLMVQKSRSQPPGMVLKPCKEWDFNYQLPSLNWWFSRRISEPPSVCHVSGRVKTMVTIFIALQCSHWRL